MFQIIVNNMENIHDEKEKGSLLTYIHISVLWVKWLDALDLFQDTSGIKKERKEKKGKKMAVEGDRWNTIGKMLMMMEGSWWT